MDPRTTAFRRHFPRFLRWAIYDLSGARWLKERILPATDAEKAQTRPPSTFMLWLGSLFAFAFTIYTGIYGVVSERYENAADRVELRANAVIAAMANEDARKYVTGQIDEIQSIRIPLEPEFGKPATVWQSLTGRQTHYREGIILLQDTLVAWKHNLESADLISVNLDSSIRVNSLNLTEARLQDAVLWHAQLQGALLWNARLQGAHLLEAQLQFADLTNARLQRASLRRAQLQRADLTEAQLQEADLSEAQFQGAYLFEAQLQGAVLSHTNLQDAQSLTIEQLNDACLYDTAILPLELLHRAGELEFLRDR